MRGNNSYCFIILTCEKYKNTRVEWQKQTFLKNFFLDSSHPNYEIEKNNAYYYISWEDDIKNHIYGWNTADDYNACPLKYVKFIKNMDMEEYDWYIFIDDDTFINVNTIKELLAKYDSNKYITIGSELIELSNLFYHPGGAGVIMSNTIYKEMREFVRSFPEEMLLVSEYGDVCLGFWINHIIKEQIGINKFNGTLHKGEDELEYFYSFHYLKSKEDFLFYDYIADKFIK